MSVQSNPAASRRCSLQEGHAVHRYTMSGEPHECHGGTDSPPRPAPQIRYSFPLTPTGRRAFVWLPEDLTPSEADRLQAIVATLPLPERAQ